VTAVEAAADAIEKVLGDHPEVVGRRLAPSSWGLVLRGEVRLNIPVSIRVEARTTTISSFLLRGPRGPYGRPAELHRLLLRRNVSTRRLHFALDGDDDVVLVSRVPTAAVDADELEQILAEILSVGESAFEALVHLAYPGVFVPPAKLRRPEV
jgi:hypothetical protein